MAELKDIFKNEIDLIQDERIKEIVQAVIDTALVDYPVFFKAQASSSSKYHPACCNVKGGIIRHVKRAVDIGGNLCRAWGLPKAESDVVIAALILHDIRKDSYKKHASLGGQMVLDVFAKKPLEFQRKNRDLPERIVDIVRCIRLHMGLWTEKEIKIPIGSYSLPELATYTADYLASRKNIELPEDSFDLNDFEELRK